MGDMVVVGWGKVGIVMRKRIFLKFRSISLLFRGKMVEIDQFQPFQLKIGKYIENDGIYRF